jgi:hypothetical protein
MQVNASVRIDLDANISGSRLLKTGGRGGDGVVSGRQIQKPVETSKIGHRIPGDGVAGIRRGHRGAADGPVGWICHVTGNRSAGHLSEGVYSGDEEN